MFYDADILSALEDVKTFSNGLTCTVTRSGIDYENIPCVITDFTFSEHAGRIIEYQDRKIIIAAISLPIVPTGDTDVITLHAGNASTVDVSALPFDVSLKIISNIPIAPDNKPIIHQLQVRR